MTKEKNIFDFKSYRAFLRWRMEKARPNRGVKSELSKAAQIQSAYLSSVLAGKSDLNLEQAQRVAQYFVLSPPEEHYFLLLLQYERAGSADLKQYFQKQMDQIIEDRNNLSRRLSPQDRLKDNDQALYYSTWMYAAVHVALTISDLQTVEKLSEYFGWPVTKLHALVGELVAMGLVKQEGSSYKSFQWARIGKESVHLLHHHRNWRWRALQAMEKDLAKGTHFSAVYSLTKSDCQEIREELLAMIERISQKAKNSKEEILQGICVDWFDV